MIDEIAVGRALYAPVSRQAAVHGIAEPLHRIARNGKQQPGRGDVAGGISGKDHDRACHAGRGQAIRRYPGRHSSAQPVEQPPFIGGKPVLLDSGKRWRGLSSCSTSWTAASTLVDDWIAS